MGPQAPRDACQILRDIASALALLHTRRMIHRDISPRNVRRTSSGRAKLIDFGLLSTVGVVGEAIGTPPLVAPESLGRWISITASTSTAWAPWPTSS